MLSQRLKSVDRNHLRACYKFVSLEILIQGPGICTFKTSPSVSDVEPGKEITIRYLGALHSTLVLNIVLKDVILERQNKHHLREVEGIWLPPKQTPQACQSSLSIPKAPHSF